MGAKSRIRGWLVVYDEKSQEWRYVDTNKIAPGDRECIKCGMLFVDCVLCEEPHDPCIGHVNDAVSVCCGHGVERGYVAWPKDGYRDLNEMKVELGDDYID